MSDLRVTTHYLDATWEQHRLLQLATVGLDSEIKLTEVEVAVDLALYAADISPFRTGSLSASHIATDMGPFTLVHINPDATNPFSDENPPEYGPKVHAMGGHRAFYSRTVFEASELIIDRHEADFILRIEAYF